MNLFIYLFCACNFGFCQINNYRDFKPVEAGKMIDYQFPLVPEVFDEIRYFVHLIIFILQNIKYKNHFQSHVIL